MKELTTANEPRETAHKVHLMFLLEIEQAKTPKRNNIQYPPLMLAYSKTVKNSDGEMLSNYLFILRILNVI